MISFSSSSQEIDFGSAGLRRSDRKRTKKIFKEDLVVRSANKSHQRSEKKHKSMFISENTSSRIQPYTIQQTIQPMNLFPYKTDQTSIEALRQMREAVNRQQMKYGQLMQTRMITQVNRGKQRQGKCLSLNFGEENSCRKQKEEMLMSEYSVENISQAGYDGCDPELVRMVTGTDDVDLQFQYLRLGSDMHSEQDHDYSMFDDLECHDPYLSQIVPCRKESAIMLSDNYQSNELTYTMEQLQPRWLREENIQHVEW